MMKAAVIGLDGAGWHVLDPMIEAGVMPHLGEIKAAGASGPLRSTLPVFTPPAWTSALTGVNPGRHGIYGFLEGNAQTERQQLLHSGKVRAPLMWDMARAQDARCGIFNLPLTYPAVQIEGWMVSGMMTPGEGSSLSRWASPDRAGELVLDAVPDYVPDLTANYETDYKSTRLCQAGMRILDHRRRALEALLDADEPDLLFAMIEVPDRLQHVYYAFLDPNSERYDRTEGRRMREAILPCYRRVDEIIGLLRARLGDEGWLIVCSDHGFTQWEVSVHTNVLLAQWGFLALRPGSRLLQSAPVKRGASVARRFLPHAVTRPAKQLSMNAIDWSRTQAFASPVQGVRLNLKGRERLGSVEPADAPALARAITERFMQLRADDGSEITDRVWSAADAYHGDWQEGASDLLPVLRGHRWDLDVELFHSDPFSNHTGLPRGVHHIDGIVSLSGPGAAPSASLDNARVEDIAPTLMHLGGLSVPEGLDGRALTEGLLPAWTRSHPVREAPAVEASGSSEASPYSAEEEAQIEEALRGLGYL